MNSWLAGCLACLLRAGQYNNPARLVWSPGKSNRTVIRGGIGVILRLGTCRPHVEDLYKRPSLMRP